MFSNLFSSLKLYAIQISPITWVQRLFLRYTRYKSLVAALQEELVFKKLEKQKLHTQLHTLNHQWKDLSRELKARAHKVKEVSLFDQMPLEKHFSFLDNFEAVNRIGDPAEKITGLEKLIAEILRLEKGDGGEKQSITGNAATIPAYKSFLDTFLEKIGVELQYWKIEQTIEHLDKEIRQITEKHEYYSQKFGFLFK
jgi:hypothetical protein